MKCPVKLHDINSARKINRADGVLVEFRQDVRSSKKVVNTVEEARGGQQVSGEGCSGLGSVTEDKQETCLADFPGARVTTQLRPTAE